jgi:glucose-1-phosphate thymidylyltransferase
MRNLLPIEKYSMIFYHIYRLKQAGIREILIITGLEHMGDVIEFLESERDYSVEFIYKVQYKAGGITQALGLVKSFYLRY